MNTPLVSQSDGASRATLAIRLIAGSDREGKRALPALDGSQIVRGAGISNYGTAGLSDCRFAADPAHPIGCQFRTSAGAVG